MSLDENGNLDVGREDVPQTPGPYHAGTTPSLTAAQQRLHEAAMRITGVGLPDNANPLNPGMWQTTTHQVTTEAPPTIGIDTVGGIPLEPRMLNVNRLMHDETEGQHVADIESFPVKMLQNRLIRLNTWIGIAQTGIDNELLNHNQFVRTQKAEMEKALDIRKQLEDALASLIGTDDKETVEDPTVDLNLGGEEEKEA